jgi:cell wall-associated NlpC family hydrolase
MHLKKKNLYKVITILGLSLVGVIILAVSSLRKIEIQSVAEISAELINPLETKSPLRDSLESFGMEFLGVPYVYGGNGTDGFDCSGFVYHVFKNFSISVPRSTSQYENVGKEISIDSVKKGDLLLFLSPTRGAIGHIGIVTNPKGMETEFIHASSGKEMQVMISSLKQPNYNRRFVRAVSVIEE